MLKAGLNIFTCSLAIEYDPERIAPADLEEFLTSADTGRVRELASETAAFFGIRLDAGGRSPA